MKLPRIFVAGATALALTGCGGGGGNDVAEGNLNQTILSAISSTSAAKTSKTTIAITVSGTQDQTQPIAITTEGDFDYEAQQGSFTTQIPSIEGQPAMSLKMVTDKSIVYTELPTAAATQYGGKTWMKADAARAGDSIGVDLGSISSSGNPNSGLDMLRAVSSDVTKVGEEDVRGASTTHYRLLLDFGKAAASETDATKKQSLVNLANVYGNQPLPADVWIDDQDRVRKLTYSIDLSTLQVPTTAPEAKETGKLDFSIEYYDFGTPVDVKLPPAEQVIDSTALQPAA